MAYYNYKHVMHRDDFAEEAERFAAELRAAGADEYEGTCDYDGDGWIVAARLLDAKDAEIKRLRASAQVVVDAYHQCREANSFQGFWTVLDDLAAEIDGRAALRRAGCICELGPSSAVPSQSCPLHGHGPIPGRK